MDPVERDLIDGLVAEPSLDRYLVYADLLQGKDDPRGELIALEVHARQSGHRDPRAAELQRAIETRLCAPLAASFMPDGIAFEWELGLVRSLVIKTHVLPQLVISRWLDAVELALLRSFSIVDVNRHEADAWPVEQLVTATFSRTLERVAIGGTLVPVSTAGVDELVARLPRLTGLEIRGKGAPDEDLLARLEAIERLEELALWMTVGDQTHERLLEAPWPRLQSLTTTGHRKTSSLPSYLSELLDGVRHPQLTALSLHASGGIGYENALIELLPSRPLGQRLTRLGFDWTNVSDTTLDAAEEGLARVELVWPRPTGVAITGGQHYTLARRLRLGLDRDRLAAEHAKQACELEPRDYFHWVEHGYVLGTLDRLPEKIEAMNRAIACDPKRWGAYTGKAAALRDLSRWGEAQRTYETALAFDPERVQIHNGLGILHARRGQGAEAVQAFDRATERATTPDDRATYACNAIEVEIEEGRLASATTRWERAAESAPDHARLRRIGGYLRIFAGAPQDALPLMAEAIAGPPGNDRYTAMTLRAAALRDTGEPAEAAAMYRGIADVTDCPAYAAFGWFGLATLGVEDPFAAIAVRDPRELADAVAAAANQARAGATSPRIVHTTEDRCDDRIHVAVCATMAAINAGRAADARALAAALEAFLAGPAPVKHNDWWLELWELVHYTAAHAGSPELAALARRTYRVATGREKPR